MGRRTVLLVVAALIAVLGSGMVFLYVQTVDSRALEKQQPVKVLKATAQIDPGETATAAMQAGKIDVFDAPAAEVLEGAVSSIDSVSSQVALATIYPGEQIITGKFGSPGEQETLIIPEKQIAMSVSLSDTGRVAGFVSPGSEVAIFLTTEEATRLLLPRVKTIAVGATTLTTTTTTASEGSQTTEQLPKTLFTLAVSQVEAQKIMFAGKQGELSFGLLTEKSGDLEAGQTVNLGNLFR